MMNNKEAGYSVGALLYSPALNEKIAGAILREQYGSHCSIALCLEDSIAESAVAHAIDQLEKTFAQLSEAYVNGMSKLPKLFVRVRTPEQIETVFNRLSPYKGILTGFIFPKYSLKNADMYNKCFLNAAALSEKKLYMMPILESEDIVDFATRSDTLLALKDTIDGMKEYVLNVRVGGNDFSNAFGVRRHIDETIYDIVPIAQLLCDILTIFSREYIVSGPVWEYYSSANEEWADGLRRELKKDALNGIIGKTVIHPKQIPIVVNSLKVSKSDYEDAQEILRWRNDSELLVGGSSEKERMNEVNTHLRWAQRIDALANTYGLQEN